MPAFPEFRQTHCVRYRYRYSGCRRCADACPHDAVRLSDEGITVEEARCQNCALCAAACRTEALVAANLPRIELLKGAGGKPAHAFACTPSGVSGDALVPCLAALDAAMLAFLAKRGIAVELRGSGHCGQCRHAPDGPERLALNLDGLEALRRVFDSENAWAEVTLAAGEDAAADTPEAGRAARRQLFRRFIGKGVDRLSGATPDRPTPPAPARAIRAAAPFATVGRDLLQTLWRDDSPPQGELPSHPALPLGQLHLGDGCTTCEACAQVCPTGALQLRESPVRWELAFRLSRCTACGVCVEVCQPGVLRFADSMDLAGSEAVTLHSLPKRRCARCDRFFVTAGDAELCPVCENDDADFLSIFG